jgi:hypothetical protein
MRHRFWNLMLHITDAINTWVFHRLMNSTQEGKDWLNDVNQEEVK